MPKIKPMAEEDTAESPEVIAAKGRIATLKKELGDVTKRIPAADKRAAELSREWPSLRKRFVLANDTDGLTAAEADMRAAVKIAIELKEVQAALGDDIKDAEDELFQVEFKEQGQRSARKIKIFCAALRKLDDLHALTQAQME